MVFKFIVFFLFPIYISAVNITVCPIIEKTRHHLDALYGRIFCNTHETLIDDPISRLYLDPSMIIVLYNNSHLPDNVMWVMEKLSSFSSVLLIDVSTMNSLDPVGRNCDQKKESFLFMNLASDFLGIRPFFESTVCHVIDVDYPLAGIMSRCPNLVWAVPEHDCTDRSISAIRLYQENAIAKSFYKGGASFVNTTLVVATLPYGPFVRKMNTEYVGISIEIIKYVSQRLHFNYIFVEPDDQAFGSWKNDNISFNGMVGMLQKREVDLIGAALTVTDIRSQAVDFAETAYFFEFLGIMIRKPSKVTDAWQWLKLFRVEAWLTIASSAVCSGIFLYLLNRYTGFWTLTRFGKLTNCVWYTWSNLVNQSPETIPITWASQTFLAFWWIFCIVFISTFSSTLIATLTTENAPMPFQKISELAELLDGGKFKMCTVANTNFYNDIMIKDASPYLEMRNWLKKNLQYAVKDGQECVDKMMHDPKLAFLGEVTFLEDYQLRFCSNISMVILRERFAPGYFSLAFQKDSPYTSTFSTVVEEIIEKDLVSKWKKNHTQFNGDCEISQPDDVIHVSMKRLTLLDFGGLFCILPIGYAISCLTFVIEKFKHQFRKMRIAPRKSIVIIRNGAISLRVEDLEKF